MNKVLREYRRTSRRTMQATRRLLHRMADEIVRLELKLKTDREILLPNFGIKPEPNREKPKKEKTKTTTKKSYYSKKEGK